MYLKENKKSLLMLAISLLVILVTSFLGSIIQTKGFSLTVTDLRNEKNTGLLLDETTGQPATYLDANQKEKTVTVSGKVVSGLLYMPKAASESNKLPAVVLTHGYLNNRELQMPFAVELARRGFIVLAIDREGHGNYPNSGTTGAMMATAGMYDSVKYLYNLPQVDKTKIGISGHSMGGYTTAVTLSSDKLNPANWSKGTGLGIVSAGLMQGWSSFMGAGADVDVGMLKAQDDEFFYASTDKDGNKTICRQFLQSKTAMQFVGLSLDSETWNVENGAIYVGGVKQNVTQGDELKSDNGFRVVYESPEIHPQNHFSIKSTDALVDFFYASFGTPNGFKYIKSSNQTWWLKEITATAGLAAVLFMIFPLVSLLLTVPFFKELKTRRLETAEGRIEYVAVDEAVEAAGTVELKGLQAHLTYWIPAVIGFFLIAFLIPELSGLADELFPLSAYFPQDTTNWVSLWSVFNGIIAFGLLLLTNIVVRVVNAFRHKEELNTNPFEVARIGSVSRFLKTLLLGAIIVAAVYVVLFVNWGIFTTDFRLWTLQLKVFDVGVMLPTMVRYMAVFGVFYVLNAICNQSYRVKNLPEWASVAINAAFVAVPILLPILIQYITFRSTGVMWQPGMNLSYIVLFPVVAVLVIATIISRYTYKKTGSIWLGAIINTILFTIMTVAGTAASIAYVVA